VSRQYEAEYHRYYGWALYWQGDALWGLSGFPILELPARPLPTGSAAVIGPQLERADAHLRSVRAVDGYHSQPADGIIGLVCDFMMDPANWAIGQLAVKTGDRLSDHEVLISTKDVDRISYEESTVFATPIGVALAQSPATHFTPVRCDRLTPLG